MHLVDAHHIVQGNQLAKRIAKRVLAATLARAVEES